MDNLLTIDSYFESLDPFKKERLTKVRQTIAETVPDAVQKIGWSMPSFYYKGYPLIYYASMKKHISIFPGPEAIDLVREELGDYKTSKGTIQFADQQEVPYGLIAKIVHIKSEIINKYPPR
jgi:uncharacterized protein YdhG (YjbR/CyaY superfamily)